MVVNPAVTATTHKLISRPAPAGGLNYRDPYAAMPQGDARRLVNIIPDVGGLRVRKGYREWATGLTDPVLGIHAYADQTYATVTLTDPPSTIPGGLFAVTDNDIYDITDSTDTPVSVFSMSGSDQAGQTYSTMLENDAGSYMLMCSEADGFLIYDGATWAAGTTTGVSPGNLVYPFVWKRRAWFVERNSTKAWYLASNAISGAASAFNFGPNFKHGGYLAYLANWTIDAGEGIDDFLVAVSSSGDVLVYQGTDPTSPSTFALVGSWYVGQIPVGRRGHAQFGGDLLILSLDGINPISYITRGGSGLLQASNKEYSSKIRAALNSDLRSSSGVVGWGMFLHQTERVLIVTVPDYSGVVDKQYAMSTTLNSWCEFNGIPMSCYGVAYGFAFSGASDGRVMIVLSGDLDDVAYGTNSGSNIRSYVQPAYEYFDLPLSNKIFHAVRPLLLSTEMPTVTVGVSTDFTTLVESTTDVIYDDVSLGAVWDDGLWDDGVWSDQAGQFYEWMNVNGFGVSGSAYVELSTLAPTTLLSIDYLFSVGGVF